MTAGDTDPHGTARSRAPYRADIDGLRAISVLSVLLFHLAPRYAPAGAIGVDIFFVISGFLIGGLLLDRFGSGTFSYADFYMRRVRRIMPALLVMIVATLAAGLWLFFPTELVSLAVSAACALFGLSNIFFYLHSDYFGDNSSAALLHTWSLGIEEQFYILMPPLIMLAMRLFGRRGARPAIGGVFVLSLALSETGVRNHETSAFYLIHSRAWELAIGVLVANWRVPLGRTALTALAAIGLALLVGSLIVLRPALGFPGLAALPPCVGAAMLLASGATELNPVHRLLAIRPLRLVGLASYSIYLWHWPIIIFAMHAWVVGKFDLVQMILVAIASIGMGFLSWRFVEGPFRRPTMTSRRVLAWCAALLGVAGAISIGLIATGGLPDRIPKHARDLAATQLDKAGFPVDPCFVHASDPLKSFDATKCLKPDPKRPNWLVVGDSHAAMLYAALQRAFPAAHLMPAISYGCAVRVDAADDGFACDGLMRFIFADYLKRQKIDGMMLTSRWGSVDSAALTALKRDLDARGIKLLLIGPAPDFNIPVARILAEAERRHDPGLPGRVLESRVWDREAELQALATKSGTAYASPLGAMCRSHQDCLLTDARGMPLYTDQSHYSDAGADLMIARMIARDAQAGAPLARTLPMAKPAARATAADKAP
jgi:peptidoglycan/LPS O-acetylase OafA/YrhL